MRNKGFTLIEVLVVAVIVAILAAVAIPAYVAYIEKAADDVEDNIASSIGSEAATFKMNSATNSITAAQVQALSSYVSAAKVAGITLTPTASSITVVNAKGGNTRTGSMSF